MRTRIRFFAIASILIVVAGCELDVVSDLYVSDLREVAAKGTVGLSTPATIAIEIPSTKKCDEYSAKLSEIMKGILIEFSPKSCKREGMESFLMSDTQIPLMGSEGEWRESKTLFGILAQLEDDGFIYVSIASNAKKLEQLNARVRDEFRQSIDLAESKVTLILNNDEREPIKYTVWGVFLDGQPIYYNQESTLKRRHTAEIELSNVGAAYLERNEYVNPLALLHKTVKQDLK